MDRIFEAQESAAYESWLNTPAGQDYARASTRLLDTILDYRQGWRVLDVGCGHGVHLSHLIDRGLLTHGLEAGPVSAHMAARRLGEKCQVDVGDAHDLPYEDNAFDAVLLLNTLELVDRPAQALAEAARVAASRVCIVSLNSISLANIVWRWFSPDHPMKNARSLGLLSLWRLVREVLGPVPQTWAGAHFWPGVAVGRWPFGPLVGVCAAVTPRYMTTPLTVEAATRRPARPAHSHGRVSVLQRIK